MEQSLDNPLVRLKATFEGHEIDVIWLRDRPHWLARQVGAALGYSGDGHNFVRMIGRDWSAELAEGEDQVVLAGEELAALKDLRPDLVDRRTPSLLLLTQSGVFAAVMLSRQPLATTFRRWLSRDVLPQLAETGSYQLAHAAPPASPALSEPQVRLQVLLDLHTSGDIQAPAFARRVGEMLEDDQLDVVSRRDVVRELVRLVSEGPARPARSSAPQVEEQEDEWTDAVLAYAKGHESFVLHNVAVQALGMKQADVTRAVEMRIAQILKGAGYRKQKTHLSVRWSMPKQTTDEVRPSRDQFAALAQAWWTMFNNRGILLADLPTYARRSDGAALKEALQAMVGKTLDPHILGNRLRHVVGEVFGGYAFQNDGTFTHGSRRWQVVVAS